MTLLEPANSKKILTLVCHWINALTTELFPLTNVEEKLHVLYVFTEYLIWTWRMWVGIFEIDPSHVHPSIHLFGQTVFIYCSLMNMEDND